MKQLIACGLLALGLAGSKGAEGRERYPPHPDANPPTGRSYGNEPFSGYPTGRAYGQTPTGRYGGNPSSYGERPERPERPDGTGSPGHTTTNVTGPICGQTLGIVEEETEGPYWVDVNLDRSNIVEDRTGVPLTLTLRVFNTSECDNETSTFGSIPSAQVDVWHCDAGGKYSDIASEGTEGQMWLRGYQHTDASGVATFSTIFPGWYQGRTAHIHVRLRVFDPNTNELLYNDTTQLFFEPELIAQVYNTTAYSGRGEPDTTNANDGMFSVYTLLNATGNVEGGLNAECNLFFPFTANSGSGFPPNGTVIPPNGTFPPQSTVQAVKMAPN